MQKSILVIDDEPAIRLSFELALEESSYEVHTADSGEKGLEMFTSGSYDLIFLDLKMPGLNGVETLQKIREMDEQVAVYIVTAFYEDFFHELDGLAQKGVSFEIMQKPVDSTHINLVCQGILHGPVSCD